MTDLPSSNKTSRISSILILFTFILNLGFLAVQPAFASPQAGMTDHQEVIAQAFPQFTSILSSSAGFAEAAGNALVAVSGSPTTNQVSTPTPIPTSSFEEQSTDESPIRGRPPLSLTLILLGFCCIFILIIGVIVLGFFVRRENRKGGDNQ